MRKKGDRLLFRPKAGDSMHPVAPGKAACPLFFALLVAACSGPPTVMDAGVDAGEQESGELAGVPGVVDVDIGG